MKVALVIVSIVAILAVAGLAVVLATGWSITDDVEELEQRVAALEAAQETAVQTRALKGDYSTGLSTSSGRALTIPADLSDEEASVYCQRSLPESFANSTGVRVPSGRVELVDGAGKIVAVTSLDANSGMFRPPEAETARKCVYLFEFQDVPAQERFYRINIDNWSWEFNQSDLDAASWRIELDR
jgi:type II secretory pathway pseudopilin PulG